MTLPSSSSYEGRSGVNSPDLGKVLRVNRAAFTMMAFCKASYFASWLARGPIQFQSSLWLQLKCAEHLLQGAGNQRLR